MSEFSIGDYVTGVSINARIVTGTIINFTVNHRFAFVRDESLITHQLATCGLQLVDKRQLIPSAMSDDQDIDLTGEPDSF